MAEKKKQRLHWLQGNYLHLIIPLQRVVFTPDGKDVEEYTPPEGSVITVRISSPFHSYDFVPTQENDVLHVTDNGQIKAGVYSITIQVTEPLGRERRSKWNGMIYIHDAYDDDIRYSYDIPEWVSGDVLDWVSASSCFGNGFWDNDAPWINEEPWNNGI